LKISLFILSLWYSTGFCFAQSIDAYDTLDLGFAIATVRADVFGNYFVNDQLGNITKYNYKFEEQYSFRPQNPSSPAKLKLMSAGKLLAFYKKDQTVVFLDRFMNQETQLYLADFNIAGEVTDVYPDRLNALWCYLEEDNQLVRLDYIINAVTESIFLEEEPSPGSDKELMRMDQYFLFLAEDECAFVGQDGKVLNTQKGENITLLKPDDLYYWENDSLVSYKFYKKDRRAIHFYPTEEKPRILMWNDKLSFYTEKHLLLPVTE
jgi:hypothetical protein